MKPPTPIGTKTQWGKITMVGFTGGERYYWMTKGKMVSMIPANTVENQPTEPKEGGER